MRRFPVEVPERVAGGGPELGRLGPALRWLAAVQGAWPPRAPEPVRRVALVPSGDLSFDAGVALADACADAGVELVVLSCDGPQVAGVVVSAALLDLEPVQAVGTVPAQDWAGLTTGVRDGLRATRAHVGDPVDLLAAAGDALLSHATGLLAQCAVRRTPVLLDGAPLTCGAALVAERAAPGGSTWWLAGQAPPNPAAASALRDLDLPPLLDLQLALPLGADLALSALLAAVEHARG